jgi:predicted phosphodiesterase
MAAAQDAIQITHGPYLQNMSDNEVTVVWVTDRNAISWVELAPDDGTHFYLQERPKFFAARNGVKLESTVHSVKLRGLKPAERYRYRVFSQSVLAREGHNITYGRVASSTAYRPPVFTTLDPDARRDVAFGMVNDIHGRSEVLDTLLRILDPLKQNMIFFNGDMVSSLTGEDDLFTGFMDVSVKAFAQTVPMYYARGNHETRGVFATRFQDYFSPQSPELYYIVRHGPVCFLVLDSGEDKPDTDVEYSGITDYDYYRTLEAEWLRDVLKNPQFADAPCKVVICHIPPSRDWHGENEVLTRFAPLLNDAKVDVMLCGHLHTTIKRMPDATVKFPVLINSNNSAVRGTVNAQGLSLEIINMDGTIAETFKVVR